ncbi:MAG: hypothetical protein WDN00_08525 [Limisphaerales bacterium]
MKIGFVSTVQGHQWPGSEYLWSACAEQLLLDRHQVVVCASADLSGAKALENLQAKGAAIHLIPPITGRLSRIQQRFFNPFRQLAGQNLDLMVVSSAAPTIQFTVQPWASSCAKRASRLFSSAILMRRHSGWKNQCG